MKNPLENCKKPRPAHPSMRLLRSFCRASVLFLFLCAEPQTAEAQEQKNIREPILAGTWYPRDPVELRRSVEDFLSHVEQTPSHRDPLGIVVPHAGHVYSGGVAAYAYHLLKGLKFERVVLIGPSHRAAFKGVSVDQRSGYRTPLGTVPTDREFAQGLLSDHSLSSIAQAHDSEHSLEIQIPFLQLVLPNARIVPLMMGQQDPGTCENLSSSLVRLLRGDRSKTLILATSDLSHFHGDVQAKSMDGEFGRHFQAYDPEGLARSIAEGKSEACGGGPVLTAMMTCKGLGAAHAVRLGYGTSGDVTGDRSRVVGYFSGALMK